MSAYELDSPDHTQSPDHQPGDEPRCNLSANETFHDVLETRLKRRDVLVGGLAIPRSATLVISREDGGVVGSCPSAPTQSKTGAL